MNSCMWARVRLSKDEEQLQRVLRDMDVESIQMVFTSVQTQIQNLNEGEHYGLTRTLGLDTLSLEILFFAQARNVRAMTVQSTVVSRRKMSNASTIRRNLGLISSRPQSIVNSVTLPGSPDVFGRRI